MRLIVMASMLGLAGCGVSDNLAAFMGAAGNVGSVTTFGRSPPDLVYSLVSGRDCSVVRLDQGKSYCKPIEKPPEPPAFCTRSLGSVDCWDDAETMAASHQGVADGPARLTEEQEANRVGRWP